MFRGNAFTLRVLVLGATCAAAACASPTRVARAPEPGEPSLTLMTYNVNYGQPGHPKTLQAIADEDTDIVLLQETNAEWETALRKRFAKRYSTLEFHHCCNAGGLAVLSRFPVKERAYIEPPRGGWFPAWLIEVETSLGAVQILNVHLRPQLSRSGSVVSGYFTTPPVREAEITRYANLMDPKLPTLVVGDFNEGDGGRAVAVLERRGFRTGLREFDTSADTWRWQTSVGKIEQRLDHVVYDRRMVPLAVEVRNAGRSDHLPVIARFSLRTVRE